MITVKEEEEEELEASKAARQKKPNLSNSKINIQDTSQQQLEIAEYYKNQYRLPGSNSVAKANQNTIKAFIHGRSQYQQPPLSNKSKLRAYSQMNQEQKHTEQILQKKAEEQYKLGINSPQVVHKMTNSQFRSPLKQHPFRLELSTHRETDINLPKLIINQTYHEESHTDIIQEEEEGNKAIYGSTQAQARLMKNKHQSQLEQIYMGKQIRKTSDQEVNRQRMLKIASSRKKKLDLGSLESQTIQEAET